MSRAPLYIKSILLNVEKKDSQEHEILLNLTKQFNIKISRLNFYLT